MITSKNLVHHEFIGLKVHVTSKKNKSLNVTFTKNYAEKLQNFIEKHIE